MVFLKYFEPQLFKFQELKTVISVGLVLYNMLYHVMYIAGERSDTLPFPQHVNNNNELLYVDSMW